MNFKSPSHVITFTANITFVVEAILMGQKVEFKSYLCLEELSTDIPMSAQTTCPNYLTSNCASSSYFRTKYPYTGVLTLLEKRNSKQEQSFVQCTKLLH